MDAFLVTIGAKATPFFVSDMRAGANLNASRRNVENRRMSNMEPEAAWPRRQGQVALARLRAEVFRSLPLPLPRGVSK